MKIKPFFRYWVPVIAYALFIFVFSSIPEPPQLIPLFPHSDKVTHFVEYAALGFLLLRALDSTKTSHTGFNLRAMAVILAIIYGISDELHQHFVPGRFMELWDLLSDGFGAYAGQLFFRTRKP